MSTPQDPPYPFPPPPFPVHDPDAPPDPDGDDPMPDPLPSLAASDREPEPKLPEPDPDPEKGPPGASPAPTREPVEPGPDVIDPGWGAVAGVRAEGFSRVQGYRNFDESHWARAQGALIDFLNADLDLALTWLRTADIVAKDDSEGRSLALDKVRAALNAIRRIEATVDDVLARREINARADELETAIAAF